MNKVLDLKKVLVELIRPYVGKEAAWIPINIDPVIVSEYLENCWFVEMTKYFPISNKYKILWFNEVANIGDDAVDEVVNRIVDLFITSHSDNLLLWESS